MDTLEQKITESAPFSHKKNFLWIFAIVIIAMTSGLVGYYIGLHSYNAKIFTKNPHSAVLTPHPDQAMSEWKTYTDGKVSFTYPNGYIIDGSKDFLRVERPSTPIGNCTPNVININIGLLTNTSYEQEAQSDSHLDNLQIKNIPNGQLFIGNQQPGQCGGMLRHFALYRHEPNPVEVSYDGQDQDTVAVFNQIVSTFQFTQ